MATFGNTTSFGSLIIGNTFNTIIWAGYFTSGPTSGTLSSISCYLQTASSTNNVQLAVYGATNGNLIGYTSAFSVGTTAQWYAETASGTLNDPNGNYFIGSIIQNDSPEVYVYGASSGGNMYRNTSSTYGTWPSTVTFTYDTTQLLATYFTYTSNGTVITSQVNASGNDSYYHQTTPNTQSTGSINTTANDDPAGTFGTGQTNVGTEMLFSNITIPQGATINQAYFYGTSSGSDSTDTVNSVIQGVKATNAAMATTTGGGAGSFENPPFTTASVNWNAIPHWTSGTQYQSPDITAIIQEIVNQGGWVSGNDIVINWNDLGGNSTQTSSGNIRRFESYDNVYANAPTLLIAYTASGGTTTSTSSSTSTSTSISSTSSSTSISSTSSSTSQSTSTSQSSTSSSTSTTQSTSTSQSSTSSSQSTSTSQSSTSSSVSTSTSQSSTSASTSVSTTTSHSTTTSTSSSTSVSSTSSSVSTSTSTSVSSTSSSTSVSSTSTSTSTTTILIDVTQPVGSIKPQTQSNLPFGLTTDSNAPKGSIKQRR